MRLDGKVLARIRDALLRTGRCPSAVDSPAFEALARRGLLTEAESSAIERVGPYAEAMYLMMAADGRIHAAEQDALRGAIRGLAGETLHDGTLRVMLEAFAQRAEREGREARLRVIAEALAPATADAENAFVLAAAMAVADEDVASGELELLHELANWLGISAERAEALLAPGD